MQSIRIKLVIGLSFLFALTLAVGLIGYVNVTPDNSTLILIAMTVGSALSLLIGLLLFRAALSPLAQIVKYSARIADGNYGASFKGSCSGEYACLKNSLETMAHELSLKNETCKNLENQLAKVRHELKTSTDTVQQTRQNADAQKHALIKGADKLKQLSTLLDETTIGLSGQVSTVTEGAANQKRYSSESSVAMEQMNASILEVARNASSAAEQANSARQKAVSGAEVVDHLTEAVTSVEKLTTRMMKRVNELGDQADGIGRIMGVITDIADQTNLLALNAAIEAARAGEAGRGFAVVADEVRKLAEKTMDATKEVGQSVQDIQSGVQGSIDEMTTAIEAVAKASELGIEADESLTGIVRIVETSADQAQAIATAAEEQSATSEEITRAIDLVSETSSNIVNGMNESRAMINNVSSHTTILSDIIEDMGDGDMTSIARHDESAAHASPHLTGNQKSQ